MTFVSAELPTKLFCTMMLQVVFKLSCAALIPPYPTIYGPLVVGRVYYYLLLLPTKSPKDE